MMQKTLHSFQARTIEEAEIPYPDAGRDVILVDTLLCGICRSDIGSYARWEDMPLTSEDNPTGLGHFGHEGLGRVVHVGEDIMGVSVGDIVSTWSDPAYAYTYRATQEEFAVVPEIDPKYILQPTACAINIIRKTERMMQYMDIFDEDILLLGTGFMSIIIGQYLKSMGTVHKLTVVGSHNREHWSGITELVSLEAVRNSGKRYKAVIDLTSKASNYDIISNELADLEALICYAATPYSPVTTNFFNNCWNCHTIIMPSPRNIDFPNVMRDTARYIESGVIDPSALWTHSYNRSDIHDVRRGFEEGMNRDETYVRGYIDYMK